MKAYIALVGLLVFPWISHASILINEIAWMGSAQSSTNEWIELYNDTGSSTSLAGWILSASDGAPKITLSGIILPNAYYLIERTDDASVPDIPADLITPFGSGLSNAGETLTLKDASGSVVDKVVGGKDWGRVGGDNDTKATAQRTQIGWTTAAGTPRAKNAEKLVIQKASAKAATTKQKQKTASSEKEALTLPSDLASESIARIDTTTNAQILFGGAQASQEKGRSNRLALWAVLPLLLIASGAVGFLYIKRDPNELRAEDFTIIEEVIDEDGNVKSEPVSKIMASPKG